MINIISLKAHQTSGIKALLSAILDKVSIESHFVYCQSSLLGNTSRAAQRTNSSLVQLSAELKP